MINSICISFLVPVYNVENYLKKCIESIIGQSYKNLEIILVDDGSTDSCPEICDLYSRTDDRVTVDWSVREKRVRFQLQEITY